MPNQKVRTIFEVAVKEKKVLLKVWDDPLEIEIYRTKRQYKVKQKIWVVAENHSH